MKYKAFILAHPEHAEETEERAARMEYDAGMNRETAEVEAVKRMREKYKIFEQGDLL